MRPDSARRPCLRAAVRDSALLWLLLLVVGLGCPSSRSVGADPASSGSTVAGAGPCHRSLEGDLRTIRSRLDKDRPDEAKIYVEELAGCPQADKTTDFLMLAGQVYEELGELNEAWTATTRALRVAADNPDRRVIAELQDRVGRFEQHYVRVVGGGPSALAPRIRYAGAVLDDVTFAQLAVVADNRYVELAPGQWGFWLYPGRYHVQGVDQVLRAGDHVDLRASSE